MSSRTIFACDLCKSEGDNAHLHGFFTTKRKGYHKEYEVCGRCWQQILAVFQVSAPDIEEEE